MQHRTESHSSRTSARRLLAGIFLAALSAITGVISYNHGLDVVRLAGNTGLVAYLVPLVPDLMIVTSSLTLIEASAIKAPRPLMAMAALVAGIGWTVAMNVAAGAAHGTAGALIAAGVPLAFVLTFESLLWLFRRGRNVSGNYVSDIPAGHAEPAEPLSIQDALQLVVAAGSRRQVADALGVPKSRVDTWARQLAPVAGVEAAEPSLNGQGADG